MRYLYLALGFVFVALGVIGAFLPLLPTTPFLIAAAACFARSSPRLESWLIGHPRFGPVLSSWRKHGAIPRTAKLLALAGVGSGFLLFLVTSNPDPLMILGVGAFMLGSLAYVFSRPTA